MWSRKRSAFAGLLLLSLIYLSLTRLVDQADTDIDDPFSSEPSSPAVTLDSKSNKRILLVSALYPLTKSKHSQREYRAWLRRYLGQITTDIYFYAPLPLTDLVLQTRSSHLYLKLNTTYPSAFSIPPLRGLEEAYSKMHKTKDREKAIHSPELYAIWNAKPFFLNEAVREMRDTWKREYDYVFWVDAGSFREAHGYKQWPDPGRVETVFSDKEGSSESIFIPLHYVPKSDYRSWEENMGPIDNEVSEGSFFGGSPKAVEWYTQTFYAYHDRYLNLGYFVGKDQTLINSLLLLFPNRFITVWRLDPSQQGRVPGTPPGYCGDNWFYYQFILAKVAERQETEMLWRKRFSWPWSIFESKLTDRAFCPLSDGLTVSQALEQAFGSSWKPPKAILSQAHNSLPFG